MSYDNNVTDCRAKDSSALASRYVRMVAGGSSIFAKERTAATLECIAFLANVFDERVIKRKIVVKRSENPSEVLRILTLMDTK